MPFLHTEWSCVSIKLQLCHVFVNTLHPSLAYHGLCPLHFQLPCFCMPADTQTSGSLRFTCPNHIKLPRLATSETFSVLSRLNSSVFAFLSLSFTPHIHLIKLPIVQFIGMWQISICHRPIWEWQVCCKAGDWKANMELFELDGH